MADEQTTNGVKKPSPWFQSDRPFWYPDAQGFLMFAMVLICGVSLFYRMTHASEVNDKILDMMITIAFSTCLVLIYNFAFGSSSSGAKLADTQNRITEKLTSVSPPGAPGPVAPLPAPVVILAWWSVLTPAEQSAITSNAPNDPRVQAFVTAAQAGKASPDELAYLVSKGLLTQDRATAIQAS